jgi:hypothetical protein
MKAHDDLPANPLEFTGAMYPAVILMTAASHGMSAQAGLAIVGLAAARQFVLAARSRPLAP